jgi:ubiquinone/menaquinone biosynthesis C-methylase UbiE
MILFPEDSPFLLTDTRKNRWAIPYSCECLNSRVAVLLEQNQDCIRGKRILDIGSHIGTFSYAALKLGAKFIHGIDTEADTVKRCHDLFRQHDVAESDYRFEVADVTEFLNKLPDNFYDTIFCFGTLYYLEEPLTLLRQMNRVAGEAVLLDTFTAAYAAVQGKDSLKVNAAIEKATLDLPLMIVSLTKPGKGDYCLPKSFDYRGKDLSQITLPTKSLLEIWYQSIGMDFKQLDWSQYTERQCSYEDLTKPGQKTSSHWADVYASEIRVAYRLQVSKTSAQ